MISRPPCDAGGAPDGAGAGTTGAAGAGAGADGCAAASAPGAAGAPGAAAGAVAGAIVSVVAGPPSANDVPAMNPSCAAVRQNASAFGKPSPWGFVNFQPPAPLLYVFVQKSFTSDRPRRPGCEVNAARKSCADCPS